MKRVLIFFSLGIGLAAGAYQPLAVALEGTTLICTVKSQNINTAGTADVPNSGVLRLECTLAAAPADGSADLSADDAISYGSVILDPRTWGLVPEQIRPNSIDCLSLLDEEKCPTPNPDEKEYYREEKDLMSPTRMLQDSGDGGSSDIFGSDTAGDLRITTPLQ